jgi:hypothetical protein
MSHLFANDTQSVWDMYDDPASDWLDKSIKRLGGEGILDREDILDFTESVQRVFAHMSDGEWYTASQIEHAAADGDYRMRSGTRRMRELRDVDALEIEKRRPDDSREYEYRLQIKDTIDGGDK